MCLRIVVFWASESVATAAAFGAAASCATLPKHVQASAEATSQVFNVFIIMCVL